MTRLTEWYPPHIKPVRVGVYNASYVKDPGVFRYWNGKYWSSAWSRNNSQEDIEFLKNFAAMDQDDIHWRGLSAAPTPEEP